jgi:hypothetical protein
MKKLNTILAIAAIAVLFISCKKPLKNVADYYPEVTTVSAIIQEDGSVKVIGEIVSTGYSPIAYEGVCMDTIPNPEMTKNQLIFGGTEKSFSVSYPDLKEKTKYYFRTWAANDNGFSYGNTIALDSVVAPKVVAPCVLSPNSLRITNSSPQETYGSISLPSTGIILGQFKPLQPIRI